MFHAPRARMSCRRPLDLAVALLLTLAAYSEADQTYRGELAEADRRAWLNDWYSALPLYRRAEETARSARDERNALYARFGRLRGEMQTLALPEASEEIAKALESPLARADAELRLRGLTVKGDIDLEWDLDAAQHDWSAVQRLAKELGHEGWENRANGELGMIAFLKGDTGGAGKLVEQALQVATKNGDVGGQLRYMSAIANGLLSAGYPQPALMFANKALDFARQHPETGFPYTVYSTKVLTHLRLGQADEAERFATTALREARTGDRRIKQIELLLMLAKIAQQRGQPVDAVRFQEQAVKLAREGQVRRLLADAEQDLAEAYRRRGDLARALEHARASVIETQASGNRFNLPGRLEVLARIYAARGDAAAADRTYQQATDVVEGIIRHVPNAAAQARLISVMGELYVGHFVLAAETLRAPAKAYRIIEQARGRALADVLRTFDARPEASPAAIRQSRMISQLQVQLMRARHASTRRELLERISTAEQGPLNVEGQARLKVPAARDRIDIRDAQKALRPDEVLIEYVLAEPRSYCLVITRRAYASRRLSSHQSIKDLTDAYVKALKSPRGEAGASATALYAALVEPLSLPAAASRLIVVPDGHLNLLPFDQLLADTGGIAQSVTLAPSASVFTLLRTPTASPVAPSRPLLAIGDVPYERVGPTSAATRAAGSPLYDVSAPPKLAVLPTARSELDSAAEVLGPRSVLLTGDQATESSLKAQRLADFNVLHFAVHAVADRDHPERAALILLSDPATGEDGLLQPREISRFTLAASVVVLSACETAAGPTIGQEGVANLARAFLLAGARSVIMTLWTVSDETSTALMRRFYANLAAGQDVAHALAEAKRAVIQRFGSAAVPTVAAFQVVGVGDATLDGGSSAGTPR